MRRNFKILGVSMMVVLSVAAIAAASASASSPLFKPSTGGFNVPFTSKSGEGTLDTVNGRIVTCTSDTNTGEITSETQAKNIVVNFHGCTSFNPLIGTLNCQTAGLETGQIRTNKLEGHLVYDPQGVDMLLLPEGVELFAEFACTKPLVKETLKVRGKVLGELTEVNKTVKTFTLTFAQKAGEQGVQVPIEYNNPEGCGLVKATLETKGEGPESFEWEQSAVTGTDTVELTEREGKVEASKC